MKPHTISIRSAIFAGVAALSFGISGCAGSHADVLYQTSTLNALLDGVYDGTTSMTELKRHGDLGIGTFHALDGEMVVLGGEVFQIRADGAAYAVPDDMTTPFAAVTCFEPDKTIDVSAVSDYDALQELLRARAGSDNRIYAIKITGEFAYVKTRSVPRQEPPYPPLAEVVKHQPVFELTNVTGTLVGFYLPEYLKGINVPGFHLHFITDDRTAGGHLLELKPTAAIAEIDYTSRLYLVLPENEEFAGAQLVRTDDTELDGVER